MAAVAADSADCGKPAAVKRISWARLLKRVFNIDISICPKCSGQIRIIAAIEDPKIIKKIFEYLGLPSAAPKLMSARGPPISDQGDMFEPRHTELYSESMWPAQEFFEE